MQIELIKIAQGYEEIWDFSRATFFDFQLLVGLCYFQFPLSDNEQYYRLTVACTTT